MRMMAKVALVTGGGSGIGRAISRLFAFQGAEVVVADLIGERALETVEQINTAGGTALAVEADVTQADAVTVMMRQALTTFGRVDTLVNNAGASAGDDILEMEEQTWDFNLDTVLRSVFLCSKAALPGMIDRGSGSVVNISSVNGLAAFGEEGYSAGKAGIINLTKNMAVKYGRFGVRANCICPATIRTPIFAAELERDPHFFERLSSWYPLGRIGEPEDVARAALFLASDDASWITGTTLLVDGGLLAGSYRMTRELLARPSEENE